MIESVTIPTMPSRALAIFRAVAIEHGLPFASLFGPDSRRPYARARWSAWARIIVEIRINGEPPSLPQIGLWSNRDHTSVLYGLRRHFSGLEWTKGAVYGGYAFGRPRGATPLRLQFLKNLAEAA